MQLTYSNVQIKHKVTDNGPKLYKTQLLAPLNIYLSKAFGKLKSKQALLKEQTEYSWGLGKIQALGSMKD